MNLAERPDLVSMILGGATALASLGLMLWQHHEQGRRPEDLPAEDRRYFEWRDRRRAVGALILMVLAAGVVVGSRIPPGIRGRPNAMFVLTWCGIFVLLLALLSLAMHDWLGTRRYARRHRAAIQRARLRLIEEELGRRRRDSPAPRGNGRAGGGADEL